MKQLFIGMGGIIAVSFMVVGVALAASKPDVGLHYVEEVDSIYKYYDQDANVICYVYDGNGISCLKNN